MEHHHQPASPPIINHQRQLFFIILFYFYFSLAVLIIPEHSRRKTKTPNNVYNKIYKITYHIYIIIPYIKRNKFEIIIAIKFEK